LTENYTKWFLLISLSSEFVESRGQLTLCNAHMPGIHPGLMNITTMIPRRRVKEGIVHCTVYFLGIKLLVQES